MKVFNKNNFMIHSLASGYPSHAKENIHVTSDFTEATNGHYLIRVYTKDEKEADVPETDNLKALKEKIDVLIPANSAREIEKAIPKKQYPQILNHTWLGENTNDDTVEFICTDLETWKPTVVRKVKERYPNTESIISSMGKDKPKVTIGFKSEYMEKLCQQFKKADIKGIKLSIYGDDKAMKLEGKNSDGQEVLVILMPTKPWRSKNESKRHKPN